jgi:lipopolysaccharide export system permease protein
LLATALLFGIINTTLFSPLSSYLLEKYKRMEMYYLQNSSTLELSGSGLWLRQPYEVGTLVIHAPHITPGNQLVMNDVMILFFDAKENYMARWDADSAKLDNNQWVFTSVKQQTADGTITNEPALSVPTTLTIGRIEDSLAQPESLSFWELPDYIQALQKTGFNPSRHRQHYYELMAQPLLFMGMVLMAAVFMQRQTRQGRALLAIMSGIGAGVVVFILNNMLLAFGTTEAIPAALAAGVVPLVTIFLATSALMHLEDA